MPGDVAPASHPLMRKLPRTWLPLGIPLVGWTLVWVYVWQVELLERYGREAGPGLTVFEDTAGDLRVVWIASGVGLFLAAVGVSFLVNRVVFAAQSPVWSRVWLVAGVVLTLLGLSLPILFPAKTGKAVSSSPARTRTRPAGARPNHRAESAPRTCGEPPSTCSWLRTR